MKKILFTISIIVTTSINAQTQITEFNGNVGISQTTPLEKLHVNGKVLVQSYSPILKLRRDTDTGGFIQGIQTEFLNGSPNFFFGNIDSSNWIVSKGEWNGERLMNIKSNGNIGLGTSAPNHNLDISNNPTVRNVGVELDASHYTGSGVSHAYMQFRTPNFKNDNTLTAGAAEIGLSNSGGTFYITRRTNVGTNPYGFVMDQSANIGIGTITPTEKLHINDGNVLIQPKSDNEDNIFQVNEYRGGSLLNFSEVGDAGLLKIGYYGLTGDRIEINGGVSNTGAELKAYDNNIAKFHLKSNGNSFLNGGNIGIGTTTPSEKLDIYHSNLRKVGINPQNQLDVTGNSSITIKEFVPSIEFHDSSTSASSAVTFVNNNKFYVGKKTGNLITSSSLFNVDLNNGNIGIGTSTPDSKLAVNGIIHTKEVQINLIGWPDYVFANDYKLPTLKEVEQHIKEKGHLANIPSAKEVEENGVKLGEMNKKLLEKVEELTLYTIQQQKQLENQNIQIQLQNKELKELKSLVKQLINLKK
ncbi:hypothetical protein [Tenacibaculum amylolyticum]|uniref:hypothetical protein n=1 Tax=Tenacibaculum amylolyticum TaxID=104269 RepID=UPI003894A310